MIDDIVRRGTLALPIAALAVVLAGCGGPTKQQKAAYAEAAKHYVPPPVMSRQEYGTIVERRFRALDRTRDDYLTPDELPDADRAGIMALDRDGDGRIGAQEFSEGMLARFDRHDLNKDGTVTSDEFGVARRGKAK